MKGGSFVTYYDRLFSYLDGTDSVLKMMPLICLIGIMNIGSH